MLTKEEIAKAKMMYFYSDCTWAVPIGSKPEMRPITDKGIILDLIVSANSDVYPCLSLVQKITDEHLIQFLKMVDFTDEEISESDISEANKKAFSESDTMANIPYYCADQLRSWGYALPYKGVDLFEAGIAIVKQ